MMTVPMPWRDVWLLRLSYYTQVLRKALGRITNRVIGVAWDTWRQQASQQRRLTSVASKGVRRIFNRTMGLALGRWQESTMELRRHRQARNFLTMLVPMPWRDVWLLRLSYYT